jgi:hypothetical protein
MSKKIIRLSLLALLLSSIIVSISFAGTIQLPQTGQTKCYDSTGAVIPCAGTGQDGDIRAGVAWPNPRFTVNGNCVTDNLTGLMWPKNGNLVGLKTWDKAIDYANNLTLCGYSDWHLPNVNELESLINNNVTNTAKWLKTQGFINVQYDNYWMFSGYWSSTSSIFLSAALVVYMEGYVNGSPKWNEYYHVWPVRSGLPGTVQLPQTGQIKCYDTAGYEIACAGTGHDGDIRAGVTWPSPRLTDNGNGTVTDNLTGLIWLKNADCINTNYPSFRNNNSDTITWQNALDFVRGINIGTYSQCGAGYSDWRLPNVNELMSLIDRSQDYPNFLPTGNQFTGVGCWYWSSTNVRYELFRNLGDNGSRVWPVRGGTVGDFVVLPDLVVTPVTFTPIKVVRGNNITVTVTTSNNGEGPSGESTTRYYLSTNKKKDNKDMLLSDSSPVQTLDSGASLSEDTTVNIPANAPAVTI